MREGTFELVFFVVAFLALQYLWLSMTIKQQKSHSHNPYEFELDELKSRLEKIFHAK